MTEDERNKHVADLILANKCPWDRIEEGQGMACCQLGFPGCSCADELMFNPYLEEETNAVLATYIPPVDNDPAQEPF